jgi:dUTP pyrophosphatase
MQIEVKIHPHGEELPLPQYASQGASGLDLYAAVDNTIVLKSHCTMAVPTGISIAIPEGIEGQVRPRSGMALKHSIGIINSPGTIDSDYRGEVKVLLTNFSDQDYEIRRGDRIAQLVIARYERIDWNECDELPDSRRGSGGFGHSGK